MFKPTEYLDLKHTIHATIFEGVKHVWEAIPKIAPYLKQHLEPSFHGKRIGEPYIGENVYIGEGTIIDPGAYVAGPAWIGEKCHIRHGAYVRENVIVGNHCVLGNSSEFKNCMLFDDCDVPHFTYVGDSILGHGAHLGAGVILSNLKLDQSVIRIYHEGEWYDTGLRKFGAIVGDHCEIGANCAINPGSILGRKSIVYPLTSWKGVLPHHGIARSVTECKVIQRRS